MMSILRESGILCLLALLFVSKSASAAGPATLHRGWADLGKRVDTIANIDELAETRAAFVNQVTQQLYDPQNPIIKRANSLADLEKPRHLLHPASLSLEGEEAEALALALDDIYVAQQLYRELTDMAVAYRLTKRDDILQRIRKQLAEVTTWYPKQRHGWSLLAKTDYAVPFQESRDWMQKQSEYWRSDGSWYATTLTLRMMSHVLELVPEEDLGPDVAVGMQIAFAQSFEVLDEELVRGKIFAVEAEMSNAPRTLDWFMYYEARMHCIRAMEGERLVASAFTEELNALRKSLIALGRRGEWEEGAYRGIPAMHSLLEACRLLEMGGKGRLDVSNYRQANAFWLLMHCLPGNAFLNTAENSGIHPNPAKNPLLIDVISAVHAETGDSASAWAISEFFSPNHVSSHTLYSAAREALERSVPREPAQRNIHATLSQRLFWRDSWELRASSVVLLGGEENVTDRESDRGHIGFNFEGRPILIESGNPPLNEPLGLFLKADSGFSTAEWHNVLKVGENEPAAKDAVLRPGAILADRGSAVINPGKCYELLNAWTREVSWEMPHMRVVDTAVTANGERQMLTYFWNLGATKPVSLETLSPRVHEISWPDATMRIETSSDSTLRQMMVPNYTFIDAADQIQPASHVRLVLQTKSPLLRLKVFTSIEAR